jgi:hypothetical protein
MLGTASKTTHWLGALQGALQGAAVAEGIAVYWYAAILKYRLAVALPSIDCSFSTVCSESVQLWPCALNARGCLVKGLQSPLNSVVQNMCNLGGGKGFTEHLIDPGFRV